MREMLRQGRVHFAPNGWWSDFFFYLAQNHVLLAAFFAHPEHPYSSVRRMLVLLSSVAWAYFLCGLFFVLFPYGPVRLLVTVTIGTVLQLAWDLPNGMLGSCACAEYGCLPAACRRFCRCFSFAVLSGRFVVSFLFALIGFILLGVSHAAEVCRLARRWAPGAVPWNPRRLAAASSSC